MYSVGTNEKSDFYELWQQHKQPKTMRDIYISSNLNLRIKFTSRSRSTEFKDILPLNLSQMITKTVPISTSIDISYPMKQGILFWACWKVIRNWDNNVIRISQWRERRCRTNTIVKRKREIHNIGTVIRVGKLTI